MGEASFSGSRSKQSGTGIGGCVWFMAAPAARFSFFSSSSSRGLALTLELSAGGCAGVATIRVIVI